MAFLEVDFDKKKKIEREKCGSCKNFIAKSDYCGIHGAVNYDSPACNYYLYRGKR
jgi:hypothetical protein